VTNSVSVELGDPELLEPLLTQSLEAGANLVHGVTFRPSGEQERRDEARSKALIAARKKAESMAAELGQKVGKPLKIVGSSGAPRHMMMYDEYEYRAKELADVARERETIAPGMVKVFARVEVIFELV
jgi:uncharacterized protein YggE